MKTLLKLIKNHRKIIQQVHIASRAITDYVNSRDLLLLHEAIFSLEELKELLL